MAAQDIQIQRRAPLAAPMPVGGNATSLGIEDDNRRIVILTALRRRWLLILITAVLSGVIAYIVCTEYRKFAAKSEAAILYTSLPNPPGPLVYSPLSTSTYAEMLRSYPVLDRLRKRAGLEMEPKDLAEQVEAKASVTSNLLLVRLQWSDAEEGVALLNMLVEEFIDEATDVRRETFRKQIPHAEAALLAAQSDVDRVQKELDVLHREQEQGRQEHSRAEDRYRSMLANIVSVQSTLDAREAQRAAALRQIELLDSQMIAENRQVVQIAVEKFQEGVLREARFLLEVVREPHSQSSGAYRRLTRSLALLEEFGRNYVQHPEDTADVQVDRWYNALVHVLHGAASDLPSTYFGSLEQAYQRIYTVTVQKLSQIDGENRQLANRRQDFELNLVLLEREIAALQDRIAQHKAEALAAQEQLTKVEPNLLAGEEHRLVEAVARKESLINQVANMRQLEQCGEREWSVVMPATMESTELTSNRKLLFALTFGLCMVVFAGPVLLAETHREKNSQLAFAHALHLPILAERVLEDFLPDQRGQLPNVSQLGEDHQETLRMLALRVQQSVHRSGAVILFTSLDTKTSALPLMTAVGECLADREERVLLVDAVSPDRSPLQVLDLPAGYANGSAKSPEHTASGTEVAVSYPGLAEYLSQEHGDVSELIRPTAHPRVDFIASGRKAFPREAMASSYLTALLDACRKNYTVMLVNGPSARYAADVQMLAARADGVVLTANYRVKKDAQAAAVVKDLVELQAPIIGVVA